MSPAAARSVVSIRSAPNSSTPASNPETYTTRHEQIGGDQHAFTESRTVADISQQGTNRAMDYFAAAHRDSHHSTPEANSSSSSSPDNINDRLRFGSIAPGIFPPDQIWDTVDLSSLDALPDFDDESFRQTSQPASTDAEHMTVPPSKIVSSYPTAHLILHFSLPLIGSSVQARRRRAQNRASQRAFRERKERHVKGLETQLELLNEKHQDLLCSYNKQSDIMMKLNGKIEQLTTDLRALKAAPPTSTTTTPPPPLANAQYSGGGGPERQRERLYAGGSGRLTGPEKFDAFSFTRQPSIPSVLYDGYHLGSDGRIVNTADAPNLAISGTAVRTMQLPDFEDLLQTP
ncbi:hypothetical protein CLCR_07239 [Cladophialophora carrionii]|uniref:BZIP domain-containing protein n=1 Tax=Cladophialophora carrionii TaxID=86049 RepID=A0A1C1CPI2_9EURO|nr:hypothetical protein CLCR_07239 [Cladophialophora carrionii]